MELKYELHTIRNSQGTGQDRRYVQLHSGKPMTADELASKIEAKCSVTRGDVKAVMTELESFAVQELTSGRRFYLPEIGWLSLSAACSASSDKPDDKVTGKDIYLRGINFMPDGKLLDDVRSDVSFSKASSSTRSTAYTADELWAKVNEYLTQERFITRREMRRQFGLSEYMAVKWLSSFVSEGKLLKTGTDHLAAYTLPSAG